MAESTQESTDINESNLFPLPGKLLFIYTKIRQKSTDCSIRLLKVLLHLFVYWYLTKKCVSCLITGISFALTFAWGSVTFDIWFRQTRRPKLANFFDGISIHIRFLNPVTQREWSYCLLWATLAQLARLVAVKCVRPVRTIRMSSSVLRMKEVLFNWYYRLSRV